MTNRTVAVGEHADFAAQRVREVRENLDQIEAGDAVVRDASAEQRLEHLPVRWLDAPGEAPDVRDRASPFFICRHNYP